MPDTNERPDGVHSDIVDLMRWSATYRIRIAEVETRQQNQGRRMDHLETLVAESETRVRGKLAAQAREIDDRITGLRDDIVARIHGLEERMIDLIEGDVAEDVTPWVDEPAEPLVTAGLVGHTAALRLIARDGCQNTWPPFGFGCLADPSRSADSKEGATRICDACIAHAALCGIELR